MAHPRIGRDELLTLASEDLVPVWEEAARILGGDSLPSLLDCHFTPDDGSDFVGDYVTAAINPAQDAA